MLVTVDAVHIERHRGIGLVDNSGVRADAAHGDALALVVVTELQTRYQVLQVFIGGHTELLDHLFVERRHGDRDVQNTLLTLFCRDDDLFDPLFVLFIGCFGSGSRWRNQRCGHQGSHMFE